MIAVLDANIALALLVELPYSAAARAALATATTALAPDLVLYESANALWRIANAGEMEEAACQEVLARLPLLFDELVPAHDLGRHAATALSDPGGLRDALLEKAVGRRKKTPSNCRTRPVL